MSVKLTLDEIRNRLAGISPSVRLLAREYRNNWSPLRCECLVCETRWNSTWNRLGGGCGCPSCGNLRGRANLTQSEVERRVRKLNPSVKVIGRYVDSTTPLRCKCKKCGHKWETRWTILSQGCGCPKCRYITLADKFRLDLSCLSSRLRKVSPSIKIVGGVYKNNKSLLVCRCSKCQNEWKARWNDLSHGGGRCTRCYPNTSQFELTVRKALRRITGKVFKKARPPFLKGRGKVPLEIDCYNESLGLGVECQDVSHYEPHWYHKGKKTEGLSFKQRSRHDMRKKTQCWRHSIKLICIPYWISDIEGYLRRRIER